jgi:hypothetical protein
MLTMVIYKKTHKDPLKSNLSNWSNKIKKFLKITNRKLNLGKEAKVFLRKKFIRNGRAKQSKPIQRTKIVSMKEK